MIAQACRFNVGLAGRYDECKISKSFKKLQLGVGAIETLQQLLQHQSG